MTSRLSEKFAKQLVAKGFIDPKDEEIYSYGMEQMAMMMVNLAASLLIGAISGRLWQCILFLASYLPLRTYAGGYHAKTKLRCFLIGIVITVAVMFSIRYIPANQMIICLLILLSGIIIIVLAPVGTNNRTLDSMEVAAYGGKAKTILLFEILIASLCAILGFPWAAMPIAMALSTLGIMLTAGMLQKHLQIT